MSHSCCYLILGDQLNWDSLIWESIDAKNDIVLMCEVLNASLKPRSSKQRTTLFLSAMRHFAQEVKDKGYSLIYYSLSHELADFSDALSKAKCEEGFDRLVTVLPGDAEVLSELKRFAQSESVHFDCLEDRHFIARPGEFTEWLKGRKQPRMEYWYRVLRKRTGILMINGEPAGGQWNYDADNRKSFGKEGPHIKHPPHRFRPDKVTQTVREEIDQYLPDLAGELPHFEWPVTRDEALLALDDFIKHRLPEFGDVQDAMWTDEPWLNHSLISSSINLKLLNPMEVIQAAEQAYFDEKAPLNAVEGFIRQILGWREYVRGLYWSHKDDWLSMNALDAHNELPPAYWGKDTHMTCMSHACDQVLKEGYGHHIQRLMVTGLFSLLWEVKPTLIHEWYLGMYVDAVAWVEIPNTIGMSQYADGGIVGSKPYIASGNYVSKMSNYCKSCRYNPKKASSDDACPMTTLYWAFIHKHQERLSQNPRLAMQVKHWYRKEDTEQDAILERAKWLHNHPDQL
jgi:deoxyribodipyrimidine photolyase-related protein